MSSKYIRSRFSFLLLASLGAMAAFGISGPAFAGEMCPLNLTCMQEFDGLGKGTGSVARLDIDPAGNVVVGGHIASGGKNQWAIQKSLGPCNSVWEIVCESPDSEVMNGLVTDAHSNIIAAGGVNGWIVRKFNPSGTLLWESMLGESGAAGAVTLSPDSSLVYVGGHTSEGIIVRILSSLHGNLVKEINTGLAGALNDAATSPLDGSAIFVGEVDRSAAQEGKNWIVLGYSSFGSTPWIYEFGSGLDENDIAYGVDIDENGNVYVGGRMGTFQGRLVKLSSWGQLLWVRTCENHHGYLEVAADSNGHIAAVGQSKEIHQYDPSGNLLCITSTTPMAKIRGAAYGDNGSLNLAGRGLAVVKGNYDWLLAKYEGEPLPTSCSLELSCAEEHGGAANYEDIINVLKRDSQGNILVGGHYSETTRNWRIEKYDDNCGLIWAKEIEGTKELYRLAMDNQNYYAAGTGDSSSWHAAALDGDGNVRWSVSHGNYGEMAGSIAVSGHCGSVWIGSNDPANGMQIRCLRPSDGSLLETHVVGVRGNLWGGAFSGKTNEVIFAGEANRFEVGQGMNLFVVAVSIWDGQQKWTYELDGGGTEDRAFDVVVDNEGNVIVAGDKAGCAVLVKLDRYGNLIWERTYESSLYWSVAVNDSGTIAGAGMLSGFSAWHIRQYDKDGAFLCATTYADGVKAYSRGVDYGTDGSLHVAGQVYHLGSGYDWRITKYISDPYAAAVLESAVSDSGVSKGLKAGQSGVVSGNRGYINPVKGAKATLDVCPTGAGEIVTTVYSRRGALVRRMTVPSSGGDIVRLEWDGRDGQGNPVAPGIYAIVVEGPGVKHMQKVAVLR